MANRNPRTDGELLTYQPMENVDEGKLPPAIRRVRDVGRSSRCRIIYVNGIDTTPVQHRATVEMLAEIMGRDVEGIYNQTSGKARDLVQCAGDYVRPTGRLRALAAVSVGFGRSNLATAMTPLDAAAELFTNTAVATYEYATAEGEDYFNLLREEIRNNLATTSLFNTLLAHYRTNPCKTIVIPHSQGNLITSDAANCLLRAYGSQSLPRQLKVLGLASPAPTWATSGERNFYWRTFNDRRDPVTWLGNVPETLAGAFIGGILTGGEAAAQGAAIGYEASRNDGNSEDVRNSAGGNLPTLDAHSVSRYILHERFLNALHSELRT